jgi:hypothetical protein
MYVMQFSFLATMLASLILPIRVDIKYQKRKRTLVYEVHNFEIIFFSILAEGILDVSQRILL